MIPEQPDCHGDPDQSYQQTYCEPNVDAAPQFVQPGGVVRHDPDEKYCVVHAEDFAEGEQDQKNHRPCVFGSGHRGISVHEFSVGGLEFDFDGDGETATVAEGFLGDFEDGGGLLALVFAALDEGEDAADEGEVYGASGRSAG